MILESLRVQCLLVAIPYASEVPLAAQRQASDPFPADRFETIEDVPVFAEHETVTKDGKKLKFGPAELQAVANRCNRRIAETGDYAVLSLGHTPSREAREMGAPAPKAVGFAGPFRVGTYGAPGARQRYAILAALHVYKDDWAEAQKNSRRSAELWVEDTYDEMFLDPIALLGAEPPRLDLGLVYSKWHPDKQILKYAAVFPGDANVHSPTVGLTENYQSEGGMALDDQDLARIVEAIQQLPEFQWCSSQMTQGQGTGMPGAAAPGALGATPPPVADAAAPPPTDSPITPAGAMPAAPQVNTPPDQKEPEQNAMTPAGNRAMWAQTDDAEGRRVDKKTGESFYDDDQMAGDWHLKQGMKEKNMAYQKACYAALDAIEDGELEEYMAGRKKRKYAAESGIDGDDKPEPEAGSYNQTANEAEGVGGSEHTIQEGTGGPPRKESEKVAHSRVSGESETLKYQLDAMKAEVNKLKAESAARYEEKTDANRRARLLQLHHEGYVLDPDKMMERLCYSKMRDDAQFDGFVDALLENVQRAPLNLDLPYVDGAERYSRARPGTKEQTEKYSKEDQDKAYKAAMRRINAASPTTDTSGWYQEELEKIHSNGVA